MIGVSGGSIISLMAGKALRRHIGIIPYFMTLITIINIVAQCKGEIDMLKFRRRPSGHCRMTFHTYVGDSSRQVIGIAGGIIISLMAGKAIRRNTGIVSYIMTLIAILQIMTLCERKE